jgi:hypothetical protein
MHGTVARQRGGWRGTHGALSACSKLRMKAPPTPRSPRVHAHAQHRAPPTRLRSLACCAARCLSPVLQRWHGAAALAQKQGASANRVMTPPPADCCRHILVAKFRSESHLIMAVSWSTYNIHTSNSRGPCRSTRRPAADRCDHDAYIMLQSASAQARRHWLVLLVVYQGSGGCLPVRA